MVIQRSVIREYNDKDIDYNEFVEIIQQVAFLEEKAKALFPTKGARGGKPKDTLPHSPTPAPGSSTPVGRPITEKGRERSKTPAEVKKKEQREQGRCFNCDQKGHLAADCPEKSVEMKVIRKGSHTRKPREESSESSSGSEKEN